MTYSGEMGKGGKSPVELKDSLVSDQVAKVLFVVSEGLIESVDNVYLDTTEIASFDAEYDWRDGAGSQSIITFSDGDGFIASESPLPGFAGKLIDHGSGTVETFADAIDHIETIPFESACDVVRLTFNIPVMSYLDPDGNLVGATVEIGIYTRPTTSSTWTLYANPVKKGKTTNGYTFDILVPRPAGASSASPWQINIKRKTKDSTTTKRQNAINLSMITQIYKDATKTYPNTALVGVKINDPTQFGNRVPEVMFRLKGKKVTIPSNYNAATKTYTGVWDGTFNTLTKYYTNNPAWILLDVLTDTRAGLGIDIADIDKYSIYNLAKYCDETFSITLDGVTTNYYRYTCDYQFQERQGVTQFIAQILSICNANVITNEFGQISVVYIYPNQPVKRNVTNANVIDGSFTYQSSGLEQRTTLVNVTYNNGNNFGRTDTTTISDDTLIDRYGLQVMDVVLPGCYYEAQAIRKARYTLYTNCNFVNFVSFSVFLEGLTYKIGDLIRVFDNYNQNETQGGLVASIVNAGGNTTITFDRPCALDAGSYTFYIYDTSGNEHTKSVTGGSTISQIVFNSTILIDTGAPFVFSGPAAGKVYRVTDIQKSEESIYSVSALEWSESIFDYIEDGIVIDSKSGDYANINDLSTIPVTNLEVNQNFGTNGAYKTARLVVSWLWDLVETQKYKAKFKLSYSRDGNQQTIIENINSDTFDIPNPVPGSYKITVWAVNPVTNFISQPVSVDYDFRLVDATSTLSQPVSLYVTGTSGTSFATRDLSISWLSNSLDATAEDALNDFVVEVKDPITHAIKKIYSVTPGRSVLTTDPLDTGTQFRQYPGDFVFTYAENHELFGSASRNVMFSVYARDTMNDLSYSIDATFTNASPAFTSLSVESSNNSVIVTVTASTDVDVKDYLVYRGTSSGFTPNSSNLIYRGASNKVVIATPDNSTYYYKAAISDSFGEDSLNFSSAVSQSSTTVTNGINGAQTFKIYYKAANQSSPPSTPSATTNGATPAGWSASPVSLTGVEAQFESDGSQPAGSTTTTWSTPYLSYFKVNKLEAITAQMGALTVDDKLTVSTGGKIASGQTAYDTGTGYWFEYNSGTPRFSLGNTSKGIAWDGSNLNVRGDVIATDNINTNATYNLYNDNSTTLVTLYTPTSGGVLSASPVYTSLSYRNNTYNGSLSFDISFTIYNTALATTFRVQYMVEVLVNGFWMKTNPDYPIASIGGAASTSNFSTGPNITGTTGSAVDVMVQSAGWSYTAGTDIAVRITAVPSASQSNLSIGNFRWKAVLRKR